MRSGRDINIPAIFKCSPTTFQRKDRCFGCVCAKLISLDDSSTSVEVKEKPRSKEDDRALLLPSRFLFSWRRGGRVARELLNFSLLWWCCNWGKKRNFPTLKCKSWLNFQDDYCKWWCIGSKWVIALTKYRFKKRFSLEQVLKVFSCFCKLDYATWICFPKLDNEKSQLKVQQIQGHNRNIANPVK